MKINKKVKVLLNFAEILQLVNKSKCHHLIHVRRVSQDMTTIIKNNKLIRINSDYLYVRKSELYYDKFRITGLLRRVKNESKFNKNSR